MDEHKTSGAWDERHQRGDMQGQRALLLGTGGRTRKQANPILTITGTENRRVNDRHSNAARYGLENGE